ncbi:MCE family protein [Rhodococcus triatomae]|uniref:Phospholipid/cholesterol/gamma-HCH transport system substrate-binding protein n=1 Tax=Rhodococcus triatomae TaxID=300028 RepID=A0A1G8REV3_9NOCA|nr:MCE family protein [Rhodococcus triatomae]QNG19645.1 MCE family protein [Rhodococcus triatomae]QNG24440.1 MCE family protein [Rhodococcus triatomae]SDJ14890.1 phospholipid/cholesterol/gamma-HCH transport system substrate-binding protein [Rhodococcus triatomae]
MTAEIQAPSPPPRSRGRVVATLLVLALVIGAASWFVFGRTDSSRTVYADFGFVNGIYTGSRVTVLGVPVGTVTSLEPKGTHVRVAMSVQGDVELPEQTSAYVLNPSVISDRHIELGPAYQGGPTLADGAEIPQERAHSPIDFDGLMGSLRVLSETLGADGGDIGQLLAQSAESWRGQGEQFNAAVRNLSSATGVVGARSEDIAVLVANLDHLMRALDSRQISLDALVEGLGELGDEWSRQDLDISAPLQDLRIVLDQMNTFMQQHGDDVGAVAENLDVLGQTLNAHQPGLAEFMDLVPLMMQNLGNSIGPDNRGRIRLNVSTSLTQFAIAKPLCDAHPLPLCTGAGFTNPISFPISASDPLGIVSAVTGGALPSEGGGN